MITIIRDLPITFSKEHELEIMKLVAQYFGWPDPIPGPDGYFSEYDVRIGNILFEIKCSTKEWYHDLEVFRADAFSQAGITATKAHFYIILAPGGNKQLGKKMYKVRMIPTDHLKDLAYVVGTQHPHLVVQWERNEGNSTCARIQYRQSQYKPNDPYINIPGDEWNRRRDGWLFDIPAVFDSEGTVIGFETSKPYTYDWSSFVLPANLNKQLYEEYDANSNT